MSRQTIDPKCVDALAVALCNCTLDKADLCRLLTTSRSVQAGLLQSCKGSASLEVFLPSQERLHQLAAWLAKYGPLVRGLVLQRPYEELDPSRLLAVSEALRLAAAAGSLCHLQDLHSTFFLSAPALQQLPSSLTRLQVSWWNDTDIRSSSFGSNKALQAALGQLTSLQALNIATMYSSKASAVPTGFLHALRALPALTALSLDGRDFSARQLAHHLQQLPTSLVRLTLKGGKKELQLDLSQLTRVTQLSLAWGLTARSALPPATAFLGMSQGTPAGLEALCRLRPSLRSLHLAWGGEGALLSQLIALSNLDHLAIDCESAGTLVSAGPWLAQLPGLDAIHCVSARGDELAGLFSPCFVSQLVAATSVTSLWLLGCAPHGAAAAFDAVGFQHLCEGLTTLPGLRSLFLAQLPSALPELMPLTLLTQLTQLMLDGMRVTDMVATGIGCCLRGLQDLSLPGDELTDGCMPALGQLTKLSHLCLGIVEGLTEPGLWQLARLTKLEHVNFYSPHVTDEVEALWQARVMGVLPGAG